MYTFPGHSATSRNIGRRFLVSFMMDLGGSGAPFTLGSRTKKISQYLGDKPLPFGLVDAMLRPGHKYDFTVLQETPLERFLEQFPQEEHEFKYVSPPMDKDRDVTKCYLDGDHSFNNVINLAVDLRLNRTLPAIVLQAFILVDSPVS
jgi:hypothetical protein